jgi:ankyrin repeat protein
MTRLKCPARYAATAVLMMACTVANVLAEAADKDFITAAFEGELVRALIDAKADVNAKTKDGQTALGLASSRGHAAVAQLLRQAGAK